ncbi:MAG: helix-turn-helix domain-containing protein [Candidatus Sigynarchaeota archaeon]|jgi:predicted DNA-binding transcriptional regulator AlpA
MRTVSRARRINDILTAEQTASMLGISIATLWRWRNRRRLRSQRLFGRTVFLRTDVEAAMKRQRQLAAG